MVASMGAAFALPFEVFLISYAVLGPFHYLTELSWLHDRGYFANHKSECVGLALIVALSVFASGYFPAVTIPEIQTWSPDMSVLGLGLALMAVVARSRRARWISLAVLVAVVAYAHWLNQSLEAKPGRREFTTYDVIFSIYLTTIIHVFVFTGAFVLYGALKTNSRSGLVSFWVFLGCAAACLFVPSTGAPQLSDYTVAAYRITSEPLLGYLVYHLPFYEPLHADEVFTAPAAIQVGRFIAWAYTYHYLNWFSKTSIIKWHEVPKYRFVIVVVIWIASLGLYYHDYREGLRWLLLLSLLHVFMEFPLNWRSFMGIGSELMGRIRRYASN